MHPNFEILLILLICLNQAVLIYLFIKFSKPMVFHKVEENASNSDSASLSRSSVNYETLTETDSKFANYISDNILIMSSE